MAIQTVNLYPNTKNLSETIKVGNIPLDNENVLLVQVNAHDRKTINKWMTYSENIRREWADVKKPLFILIDMKNDDFSFGRYANQRAGKMMQIQPEIPTYIAWVLQESLTGNLLKATLNLYNMTAQASRFMIVHSREEGYEWLQKTYQKNRDSDSTK